MATSSAAPTSSTTCSGTPTGAQLSYDDEGRLSHWQNAPSSPTATDDDLYDGAGQRVEQQAVVNGTTTTSVYVGNLEELDTSGSTTTTTVSYSAGGKRIAESVNGTISYLASDVLGSAEVALSGSGGATASVLYGPYGTTRYSNGTMPGSYGFTGQHSDSVTGLDDYGARYYDPTVGQFTSADSDPAGGLNRFAYVGGNPETKTDPTGHLICDFGGRQCVPPPTRHGGGGGGGTTGGGTRGSTSGSGGTGGRGAAPSGAGGNQYHAGITAAACYGYAHCVILIGGVNAGYAKTEDSLTVQEQSWLAWINKLLAAFSDDVGFILFEAPDVGQGARQLHQILQGLAAEGYAGAISLVGHSNGAATIFHYLAQATQHGWSDPRIAAFVALDAPIGSTCALVCPAVSAADYAWAEWIPSQDLGAAAAYMAKYGTRGTYAYDPADLLSGPLPAGPWSQVTYYSVHPIWVGPPPLASLPFAAYLPGFWCDLCDQVYAHTTLLFDPPDALVQSAVA